MAEERRDNSIYVIGFLVALGLVFYGLWTEEHPVVIEIVELVTNKTVEFLDPKVITRVNKEIVHLTATPGVGVNDVIYATPAGAAASDDADIAATVIAEVEATLRALTPVVSSPTPEPSQTPEPASTMYLPPAPSTLAPMPATQTPVPAPPTLVPAPPTEIPPTQIPPTQAPPTQAPPTQAPPTQAPPTQAPPTQAPPTQIPPTQIPPTQIPPTQIPPTQIPPTVPPTAPPQPTLAPTASPELVAPDLLNSQDGNTELAPAGGGSATLQGNITGSESGQLTMILTNGDYFQAMVVGSGGNFSFPDVPNA